MKFSLFIRGFFLLPALTLGACQSTSGPSAGSYEALKAQGYKIGSLTSSRGGAQGWYMTDTEGRYFCNTSFNIVEYAPGKVGVRTSSGRYISIDVEAYKEYGGYDDFEAPKLTNLKAGRVRPQDVGSCKRVLT
ncbi:hypothetical protein [Roseibium algae]|uniref:Lipoprotein n=1 Tax=Roseibium algae TaxID=3123038 RepID=A0ABU8TQL5_9HYPH